MQKSNLLPALLLTALFAQNTFSQTIARGIVYHDKNQNNIRDENEKPLPNIPVSNGVDIVLTDKQGKYQLPVTDDTVIFVIKPAGWMTTTDKLNIPRFYYIHNPKGSPQLKYGGIEPTGPLPDSIDFALHKNKEPEKFDVVIFGDPQLRNEKELGYFYHDAIEEIIGTKAAFGVTLGDIAYNKLHRSLYQGVNEAIALLGINWYPLPGNHDMDYDADSDAHSLDTYRSVYGPTHYAFNYADVHFLVLDTIIFRKNDEHPNYDEGLTDDQLQFMKNDLALVDKNKLIVLLSHANLTQFSKNKTEAMALLAKFPYTLSVAGHEHTTENVFLTAEQGWPGAEPHHLCIAGAVCGGWWFGFPGEDGVPNAMMANGVPNGYSVITFDKNKYSIRFKAFGKPADFQMRAWLPEEITTEQLPTAQVVLNVFAGSEKSVTQMKIDAGPALTMTRTPAQSHYFLESLKEQKKYNFPNSDWLGNEAIYSAHMWTATLPKDLLPGTHILYFRSTDMYGETYYATRVFRIIE